MTGAPTLDTPDGRYFVARGRLWRKTDPRLDPETEARAVKDLMRARRAVGAAETDEARRAARELVDDAKRRLGERGPVWWRDGAPDETRLAPWNSTYAEWWHSLDPDARERVS